MTSRSRSTQDIVVDFAVHFVKANGSSRPKVFKLRRIALGAGERVELTGKVSFAPMTTRRPYPGEHRIDVLTNGVAHALARFGVA